MGGPAVVRWRKRRLFGRFVLLVWFGRFGFSNGVQLKKIAGAGQGPPVVRWCKRRWGKWTRTRSRRI